jgi:SAM-dependent methyltransferase
LNDFWKNYWSGSHDSSSKNPQIQVARTRAGVPINDQIWLKTVQYVKDLLEVNEHDRVLDACGGNGLFANELSSNCREIVIVDINSSLLSLISDNSTKVKTINSDLLVYLNDETIGFDKILFYAGIQYFSELEVFKIIRHFKTLLNPGGTVLIGDVPDFYKRDFFLSENQRFENYFNNFAKDRLTIGSWFTFEWIRRLSLFHGFTECTLFAQPEYQIYHDFRFDVRLKN